MKYEINIIGLKNGDPTVFIDLYFKYKLFVKIICRKYFCIDEDIEDAIQESFMRIYEKRNYIKTNDYFHQWVSCITKNVCISILRNKHRTKKFVKFTEHIGYSKSNQREITEFHEIIKQINYILPPQFKRALILKTKGYTETEISKKERIPVSTVKTRIHRARKLLKEYIDEN